MGEKRSDLWASGLNAGFSRRSLRSLAAGGLLTIVLGPEAEGKKRKKKKKRSRRGSNRPQAIDTSARGAKRGTGRASLR